MPGLVNGLYVLLLLLLGCCLLSLSVLLTSSLAVSPALLCLALSLLCAMLQRVSVRVFSPSVTATSGSPQQSPTTSPSRRRRYKLTSRTHPYANLAASPLSCPTQSCHEQRLTADACATAATPVADALCNAADTVPLTIHSPTASAPPQPSDMFHSEDTYDFPALRNGRYRLLRTIQSSLFGCVKLAVQQSTGRRVCIKVSCLQRAALGVTVNGVKVEEDVQREGQLLRYLHAAASDGQTGTAGLVQFVEVLRYELFYYLVLGDAGCDLYVHLRHQPILRGGLQHVESVPSITETAARDIFCQLIDVVQFCHRQHVALNDLSLENVCIDYTGRVRVIDLGLAAIHPLSPQQSSDNTARQPLPAESPPLDSFFPVVPLQDSGPLSGKLHYVRHDHRRHRHSCFVCLVLLLTRLSVSLFDCLALCACAADER